MATDICCSTPQTDGCHWRLWQECQPCPPDHRLWLQGTLINEKEKDLVIPDCQSRALWRRFTTCYAELRISKTAMVETGLIKFWKKPDRTVQDECCLKKLKKKTWFYPGTLASMPTRSVSLLITYIIKMKRAKPQKRFAFLKKWYHKIIKLLILKES